MFLWKLCQFVISYYLLFVTGNKGVLNDTTMQTKKKPHELKWKDRTPYCTYKYVRILNKSSQ